MLFLRDASSPEKKKKKKKNYYYEWFDTTTTTTGQTSRNVVVVFKEAVSKNEYFYPQNVKTFSLPIRDSFSPHIFPLLISALCTYAHIFVVFVKKSPPWRRRRRRRTRRSVARV
jgi:hypothetical protein|tara:strand:+ start:2076 stop:2417 length:342 start_codon:yes stop_codon:yes gene_type:complete